MFGGPADHILDIINTTSGEEAGTDGETEKLQKRQETVDSLAAHYSDSKLAAMMKRGLDRGANHPLPVVQGDAGSRYATSWLTQFAVLFMRTIKLKVTAL